MPGNKISRLKAIHEAGHAVVAWALNKSHDRPFVKIVVRTPNEMRRGPYITSMGREVSCGGCIDRPSYINNSVKDYIMMCLSGYVAVAHDKGTSYEYTCWSMGGYGDYEDAESELIRELEARDEAYTEDDLERYVLLLQSNAGDVVEEYMPAIKALADELQVRRVMTYEEALPVMQKAMGCYTIEEIDAILAAAA